MVPVDDTPGCEAADYAGLAPEGTIALVSAVPARSARRRQVAGEAGAAGVLVYNNVPGALAARSARRCEGSAPAGGITQADGQALAAQNGAAVTLDLQGIFEDRTTYNVIAETQTGRHEQRRDGRLAPRQRLRRARASTTTAPAARRCWRPRCSWAARRRSTTRCGSRGGAREELGLIGSEYYVQNLTFEEQLDIALYLNFDMIGSPNAGYFVFDGDDSDGVGAGPGPYGSAQIEAAFQTYFDAAGVPTEGKDFDGRSDYGEFIAQRHPGGRPVHRRRAGEDRGAGRQVGRHRGRGVRPVLPPGVRQPGQRRPRRPWTATPTRRRSCSASYAISTEDVNGVPPRSARAKARAAQQHAASAKALDEHAI